MKNPTIRNRFHHARRYVQLADAPEKALTQQQFKDECDMNRIVQNAQRGIAPRHLARGTPQYGDFSRVPDLADAYNTIQRAESAFMNLPAELRLELGNDPANIGRITPEQIKRHHLGREARKPQTSSQPPSQPSDSDPAPKEAPKGASKKATPGEPGV